MAQKKYKQEKSSLEKKKLKSIVQSSNEKISFCIVILWPSLGIDWVIRDWLMNEFWWSEPIAPCVWGKHATLSTRIFLARFHLIFPVLHSAYLNTP